MERAGIHDTLLERIQDLQQTMQSRQMRTIKSSVGDAVEVLRRKLVSGEEVKLADMTGWFGS